MWKLLTEARAYGFCRYFTQTPGDRETLDFNHPQTGIVVLPVLYAIGSESNWNWSHLLVCSCISASFHPQLSSVSPNIISYNAAIASCEEARVPGRFWAADSQNKLNNNLHLVGISTNDYGCDYLVVHSITLQYKFALHGQIPIQPASSSSQSAWCRARIGRSLGHCDPAHGISFSLFYQHHPTSMFKDMYSSLSCW